MVTRRALARIFVTTTVVLAGIVMPNAAPNAAATTGPSDHDWLGIVNTYRAMSGLRPLSVNGTWSSEAVAHSCYMLFNGISHDEIPGLPGYTDGGRQAGLNGNVAVSSSVSAAPRSHIDLWMTGPFHAIGILRHNLTRTGFGLCANNDTSPWRSGATLDVLRGIDSRLTRPAQPIVFPGREATVPLTRFVTESPNPITLCKWTGSAGLPLIAMMPAGVSGASSSLVGPNGPVETCTLHPGNTGSDATAKGILQSENAVVVVPRVALATGRYTATVNSTGGNVSWSFNVDPLAPLTASAVTAPQQQIEVVTTKATATASGFTPVSPYRHADSRISKRLVRLRAGQPRRVEMAGAEVTAVSANFTVAEQTGRGHLRVYNCTTGVPMISTVNFTWTPTGNQSVVPLSKGGLCLFSTVDTHLVIDVNGHFLPETKSTTKFTPLPPVRIFDSRRPTAPSLGANEKRRIKVAGVPGGAPTGATAVAVNLTVVNPSARGFVRAFPCDQSQSSEVSSVNFAAQETRPNSAIVPVAADGTICLQSKVATNAVLDLQGYFSTDGAYRFTPLNPVRLFDSRSTQIAINAITKGKRLDSGQVARIKVAGLRGVPVDAKAVSVNLTAADSTIDGFVTAFPCGTLPEVSNLNAGPGRPAVGNGAMVGLNSKGELCVFTARPTHLIIDISGTWS